ncbi:MAG: aspartate--ammonia ligase [Saccharofermentanales bacterium]|jgi:aspartate--ammonia ligase|nr:aspartate--ammonia ligase [Clostridiaceae bacterium]
MNPTEKHLVIPVGYQTKMNVRETEIAIKLVKDQVEAQIADTLNLTRVSAPLYVRPETGLNDNLSGVERPVSFDIQSINAEVEVVQSLAKWKRMALLRYGFQLGEGIYADMNAIRRDEELDNIHSVYVDQWDWELIISREQRTTEMLKQTVLEIYRCLYRVENHVLRLFSYLSRKLPTSLFFITSQELEDRYPHLTPKQREDEICRQEKAVFILQIGDRLKSGGVHDGRAPDYDDWSLNGDLLFWYPTLDRALEISSMGIRVDEKSMREQLIKADCSDRMDLEFHRMVLDGSLPYTIGGGIGQSRLCMFYLDKAHIGEVQASVWPDEVHEICRQNNIVLL